MAQPNLLRPITQRLVSTPVQDLPQVAHFLASSISTCSQILKAHSGGRGNESAVLVHKLKTRLTALLQDRSSEGRFTAVVLIKATVEAGGLETLSTCEPWVRGLIAILSKPDPVAVKKLCIISITRIISLTQPHPSLLREITSPLLPAFITACFNLIRPKTIKEKDSTSTVLSPLLLPVLQSWLQLLLEHPTTFRPFVLRIQVICFGLLSDESTPEDVIRLASRLLASLHLCAPKNGSPEQWSQLCHEVLSIAHETADQIFHPVLEDWVSSHPMTQHLVDRNTNTDADRSSLRSLSKWSGTHSGASRIRILLMLLSDLVAQETAQVVPIPIGLVLNLTSRFTSVTVPFAGKDNQYTMRLNAEVGRDEREQLWTEIVDIHIASLQLLTTFAKIFSKALLPVCENFVEQAVWTFGAGVWHDHLRAAVYDLFAVLCPIIGPSLTRQTIKPLIEIIKQCSHDLSSPDTGGKGHQNTNMTTGEKSQSKTLSIPSAESFLGPDQKKSSNKPDLCFTEVQRAAGDLIPLILRELPAELLPHSLRAEIDRTIILTQHKTAMFASVLNPPPRQQSKAGPASILPFVARSYNAEDVTEALLRPRMPVLKDFSAKVEEDDEQQHIEESWNGHSVQADEGNADLLTQLEDSLDRNEGSMPADAETKTDPMDYRTSQPTQILSPLKRGFSSLVQNEAVADPQTGVPAPTVSLGDQDIVKKPRLEETTARTDTMQNGSGAQAPTIPDSSLAAPSSPEESALQPGLSNFQINTTSPAVGLGGEDGDSSDSEIPTIDIEPDTEDEDEMDEH